jgi:hypothetical protein
MKLAMSKNLSHLSMIRADEFHRAIKKQIIYK